MSLKHLTVEEWEEVSVGPGAQLDWSELSDLLAAWQRCQPNTSESLFSFGARTVRPRNWLGTLRGSAVQMEVIPRGAKALDSAQRQRLDANVNTMLTTSLAGFISSGATATTGEGSRFDASVIALVEKTLDALRTHRPRLYRSRSEESASTRGRIDPVATDLLALRRPGMTSSRWVELSDDSPELRLIKSTLLTVQHRVGIGARRHLDRLLVELEAVGTVDPRKHRNARQPRRPTTWEAAIALAGNILDGQVSGLLAGGAIGDAELVSMPTVFEQFVHCAMAEVLGDSWMLRAQTTQSPGEWVQGPCSGQRPEPFMTDLELRRDNSTHAVLDTKWKVLRLDARSLGIASTDLQQMISYAEVTDCETVGLVFPWLDDHSPFDATPVLRVRGSSDIKVFVYCLPILADSMSEAVAQLISRLLADISSHS